MGEKSTISLVSTIIREIINSQVLLKKCMTISIQAELLQVWCSGALRCVPTSCQEERSLENQLLLLINLEKVIRPSLNNLKFTILQRQGLFTNGMPSRKLECPSKFSQTLDN